MKNLTSSVLLATAVVLTLTACGEQKDTKNNKVVIEASANMQASELADAGEQLITPYTFMLADKVFDQAIEKDATNVKAQFYKNFLKRFMVFKGIYTRIRPAMEKSGNLESHDLAIKNMPNSAVKTFFLDGKQDLKTIADAQGVLAQYQNALSDFRTFLRSNADANITLNMNPYLFEQDIREEWGKSCVIHQKSETVTKVECDTADIATKKVNAADLMLLRQATAMELLTWTLYNSYSFEGFEAAQERANGKELSIEEKIALVKESDTLLTLRKDNKMAIIKDAALDLSAAIKWATKYQDRLCPKGDGVMNQRKGFLFSQGICLVLDAQQQQSLKELDTALAGPVEREMILTTGETAKFELDVFAWSKNPPKDLRKLLLPVDGKYKCGDQIELQDSTFGGIFVNGDANRVINTINCEK